VETQALAAIVLGVDSRRRRPTTAAWLTGVAWAGWAAYVVLSAPTWLSWRLDIGPFASSDAPPPSSTMTMPMSSHDMAMPAHATSWPTPDWLWAALMWLPMLAMMAPWIRYNVRFVTARSPGRRRLRTGLEIFAAWFAVWLVALVPIGLVSELLSAAVGESAIVIAAGAAAAWQLTPVKRRALSRCDRTMAPPMAARAARRASLTFGVHLGWWCVVSDWALMFVMGAAHHHPVAVVGLLAISWFERFRLPHHDRRSRQTGLWVAVCGIVAVTATVAVVPG
jgi:predicted metal-binding membrane protein